MGAPTDDTGATPDGVAARTEAETLSVLALEPWLGGSHLRFLEGWRARSRHRVEVLGLPARYWKWRMEAGAWSLARRVRRAGSERPDVLLVSGYLDLARFRGFAPAGWAGVPALLFMHENQLTYPARDGAERDLSHGFANVLSCIAAEAVVFNTRYHLEDFRRAAAELCARLPRPGPGGELERALARARVVAPGVELEGLPLGPGAPLGAPLRVAFNHRWEHDKDPCTFLRAVIAAREGGAALEVVLLGERFARLPDGASELVRAAGDAVLYDGWAPDRAEYARLLGSCDLIASSARHEFFGLAVLEGLAVGCSPLLPRRLSYPEILPEGLHGEGLYEGGEEGLTRRLVAAARRPGAWRRAGRRRAMRAVAEGHDARRTARELDGLCEMLARPCVGGDAPRG